MIDLRYWEKNRNFTTIASGDLLFDHCTYSTLSHDTLLSPAVAQFTFRFLISFAGLQLATVAAAGCSNLGFVVELLVSFRIPSSFRRLVGFVVVNFDIVNWPWLKVKASLKVQGFGYFNLD